MSDARDYYLQGLMVVGKAIKALMSNGYRLDDLRQMNTDVLEAQAGMDFPERPPGLPPVSVDMYLNTGWHKELINN